MFKFSKKALAPELAVEIAHLVPGETVSISFNHSTIGQQIMNECAQKLELPDKDFYGLKVIDQIQWLDLNKPVWKQVKHLGSNAKLELRFKFYPARPALLANEATRYYLYLQLRLDLLEGRLLSENQEDIAFLIACVLQSELGDFVPAAKNHNYVSEFKFVTNQTEELEWAAIRLHKSEDFLGLKPADSELNFLKKARQLDLYGIEPYPVKDDDKSPFRLVGVNHMGVSTFKDSKAIHRIPWSQVEKISLDNNLVLVDTRTVETKDNKVVKSKLLYGYRCPKFVYALNLWKLAVEHQYFFSLEETPKEPLKRHAGGFLKKNAKLVYSGRVHKDILRDNSEDSFSNSVRRSHSLMSKTIDGPRWRGFTPGKDLKSSLHNLHTADLLNKTSPPDMGHFREEEEDTLADCKSPSTSQGVSVFSSAKRASSGSTKETSKPLIRRSILTSKSDSTGLAIRKGSQIYLEMDEQTNDFVRTSIFLVLVFTVFLFIMLIIEEADRPNFVSLVIARMNLEQLSATLRQDFYQPIKAAFAKFSQ